MLATPTPPARPGADKRAALLAAALRLIARSGLHATPTAAVAREAGVAAGTLYVYFPSKEALINALYLELLEDEHRAASGDPAAPGDADADPRELLWRAWHTLARWHLDHPEASRVMYQCRTSGILTAETRAAEARARGEGLARFAGAIARGLLRDLPVTAFWALYAGPIFALADAIAHGAPAPGEPALGEPALGEPALGEPAATDALLRATFDGVCRAVLPPR